MGTIAAQQGMDGGVAGPGGVDWDIIFVPVPGFEYEIYAITVCNTHASAAKTFSIAISIEGTDEGDTPIFIVKDFSLDAGDTMIVGGEGLLAHIGQGDALLVDGEDSNVYLTVAGRKQKIGER